jgi:hypothetical protein
MVMTHNSRKRWPPVIPMPGRRLKQGGQQTAPANAYRNKATAWAHPIVQHCNEMLTGTPRNCGTNPVGLLAKGSRSSASTIDFTYRLWIGTSAGPLPGSIAYLPHSLEMVLTELTVSVTAEVDRPASELSLIVGDFVPVTFTCWPRYWLSLMLSAA